MIFINKEQIHKYISACKPLEETVGVPDILYIHIIESSDISTKLLWNASYISNRPDITVPVLTSKVAGLVPSSDLYELCDWMIVRHLFYIIPTVNLFYFCWNQWWPIDDFTRKIRVIWFKFVF